MTLKDRQLLHTTTHIGTNRTGYTRTDLLKLSPHVLLLLIDVMHTSLKQYNENINVKIAGEEIKVSDFVQVMENYSSWRNVS